MAGSALADGATISGHVVSPIGQPVGGVTVNLVGAANPGGWGPVAVTTDDAGAFAFASVVDGTYGLSFSSDGTCGSAWNLYYYNAAETASSEADATPVTISGSDVADLALTCPQTYSISGRVLSPAGKPLAGIDVDAWSKTGTSSSQTLADGTYTLTGLTPGSYSVGFYDEAGKYQLGATPVVTISSADVAGVDATMAKSLTISGRVKDVNGNGLGGLQVTLGAGAWQGDQVVTTAADGTFTIPGGTPDQTDYLTVLDPNGVYAAGAWSQAGLTMDLGHANQVSLAGGSIKGIQIVDQVGGTIAGTILDPDGNPVVGATLSPIVWANGAVVVVHMPGLSGAQSGSDGTFTMADLPPATTYLIQVQMPDGSSWFYSTSGLVASSTDATAVTVAAAETASIDIDAQTPGGVAYSVSGTLTGSDGNPVGGAQLYLECASCASTTEFLGSTDDSGTFSISNVAPGLYRIDAEFWSGGAYVGGFITDSGVTNDPSAGKTFTIAGDTTLSLALPVAEHITGRVTAPNGIPEPEPGVGALSGGQYVGSADFGGEDGSFNLNVPAGSYAVALNYGGAQGFGVYYRAGVPGSYTFTAAQATQVASSPTGGQNLTIVDPGLPQIAGRLVDGNGTPLGGAYVYLYKVGDNGLPSRTTTDEAGWFSESATPGQYRILVGGDGHIVDAGSSGIGLGQQTERSQQGWYTRHGSDHFTLNPAKATIVTVGTSGISGLAIHVPAALSIGGTVTRANGKGITGIRVEALDPTSGAVVASGVTGANGAYAVVGLNAGPYKVRFVDPSGVYRVAFAGKKGTVTDPAKAWIIKLATKDQTGVDGTLARTKN